MIGTGELTLAPSAGLEMLNGKPQRGAGGGSGAGGTIDKSAGGVGVISQLATFLGSPWHPANLPRSAAKKTMATRAPRCRAMPRNMLRISPSKMPSIPLFQDLHLRAVRNAVTLCRVTSSIHR